MDNPNQQWWWPGEGRQEVARERCPKVYGEARRAPPPKWVVWPRGVRPELQPPDPRLKDPGFWKPSPSIDSLWIKLWEPSTRPSGGPSTALMMHWSPQCSEHGSRQDPQSDGQREKRVLSTTALDSTATATTAEENTPNHRKHLRNRASCHQPWRQRFHLISLHSTETCPIKMSLCQTYEISLHVLGNKVFRSGIEAGEELGQLYVSHVVSGRGLCGHQ